MARATWSFVPSARFSEIATEWDALSRASSNVPILDSRFFALLMEHFPLRPNALVGLLHDSSDLACATIIERTKFAAWQTYQPSQAPLGAWISRRGIDIAGALSSFFGGPTGLSLVLGVTQMDVDFVARPAPAPRIRTFDYIETSSITVSGSFEDYWAQRGKNLRQNVRKQKNRFERDGMLPTLNVIKDPNLMNEAVESYGSLESRGWKATTGTAIHPTTAQGRFYRDLLQEYASRGQAVVYQYMYGSNLVASDLCLTRDGVLILLKTCYDEEQRNSSPAILMHHDMLESIFRERQYRRVEFYGKRLEWHTRFTDEKRVLYHLNYFRFPWLDRRRILGSNKEAAMPP
jgi:hypothetical protein